VAHLRLLQLKCYAAENAPTHHRTLKTVEPVGLWYVSQSNFHGSAYLGLSFTTSSARRTQLACLACVKRK
jgi:hypothetical protein